MTKPIASLSLDLDNKWAYLRTHGVAGWSEMPSYLNVVVPRVLTWADEHDVCMTCFVVGRDAERDESHGPLCALAEAGHEIGNHSLNHYPWMHTLSRSQIKAEIATAEAEIERATGRRPVGFRGPGYSLSEGMLELLAERGYWYDATTLPTPVGPLARWYFRRTASIDAAQEAERRELFGAFGDCFRPIKPYVWTTAAGPLVEIPVTTFPFLRMPIHMTYVWHLYQFSPRLARFYVHLAVRACRLLGVGPSVLLHPLDFLGADDEPEMRFFPGMNLSRRQKLDLLADVWSMLDAQFRFVPLRERAAGVAREVGLELPRSAGAPATVITAANYPVLSSEY
jgi:hypothetical protein